MKNNRNRITIAHAVDYKKDCKPISVFDYKQNCKTMLKNEYSLNIICFKKVRISKVAKSNNNRYMHFVVAEVDWV